MYSSKPWYYGSFNYYGKTMELRKKLWYYGEKKQWKYTDNYEHLIYSGKNHGILPKLMEKTKIIEVFEQIYIFRTLVLWKKTIVLWKKLCYYTENYGTSIYHGKNYGTIEKL